jgi:cytochrome c
MTWRKALPVLGIAIYSMSAAVIAAESDGEALLAEKRCDACHDLTKNLLGPPYKAIAARHAAQQEAMVEVLAQKIILGGAGNWGVVPMVPNDHVSLAEARAMSRWILEQK